MIMIVKASPWQCTMYNSYSDFVLFYLIQLN